MDRPETVVDPGVIDEPYLHVVAAIVWQPQNRDEFLIARRQHGKHLANYWELPGGKLETGEDRWSALKRELCEEIGIEAISGDPFLRVYHRYPDRNILLDSWMLDAYRGEARAREGQQLAWVNVPMLNRYRFPAADLPILDAIKRSVSVETRRLT